MAASAVGSLAGASRQLGLTPMAASRHLAALERSLGTRLMHRTTRAVTLTAEGEEFLPLARTILDAVGEASSTLAAAAQGVSGLLRVTTPGAFGRRIVLPVAERLMNANPKLRVELEFDDKVTDIATAGMDLAIRIAPPNASELIGQELAPNPRVLCASPDYLKHAPPLRTLKDLELHACIRLTSMPMWPFLVDGHQRQLRVDGRFSCNSVEGVRAACIQGLGLAMMTQWDVVEETSGGSLIPVLLEEAAPPSLSVWALYPTRKYVPQRVRAFISELKFVLERP
ncbi:LysR family transcriptional regulator [Comamonas thiooxydans]|uniref:LysR family transcriptional regulator n=1 Tax=Comamonas thiooxydans TaxID=363952 RepID=UPI001CA370F1|nr:LysR family transcriptional regulator [Comamonas thiooxydans]